MHCVATKLNPKMTRPCCDALVPCDGSAELGSELEGQIGSLRGQLLRSEQEKELMRIKLQEEKTEREKAQKQVRCRAVGQARISVWLGGRGGSRGWARLGLVGCWGHTDLSWKGRDGEVKMQDVRRKGGQKGGTLSVVS